MNNNEKKKQLLKQKLMILALVSGINAFSLKVDAKPTVSEFETVDGLDITSINMVTALIDVNIRQKNSANSKIIGVLKKGEKLEKITLMNNGWYKVKYNDKVGYINSKYLKETNEITVNSNKKPDKCIYITKDTSMFLPKEYTNSNSDEIIDVPKLEFGEVYYENDEYYLIVTADNVGYVKKSDTKELTGTYVVVDISDQCLKMYENNELILETPVVTGRPSSPSDEGLFKIYNITTNRYLVGPNYRSYVDVMLKYNGGEGLHDAEYHTNSDGRKHGWRSIDEFGGDTYLTNGSHGCINMPHEAAIKAYENLELNDKVLVKK